VIKDNKIQVRAKHEEKTPERLCKSKFSKEYELSEKIETLTLTGGLSADGKLYVGAYAKGHSEGTPKTSTTVEETPPATASAAEDNDSQNSSLKPCNVLAATSASSSTTALPSTSNPGT
jgi:hypothetical protein